jgi:hypothetical protein
MQKAKITEIAFWRGSISVWELLVLALVATLLLGLVWRLAKPKN